MTQQHALSVGNTIAKNSSFKVESYLRGSSVGNAFTRLLGVTLIVVLSGCSFFGKSPEVIQVPVRAPIIAAPVKPTALNPDAQLALAQARIHVAQAAERTALWTSISQLLKQAETAALQFDSPLTTKLAVEVSDLCATSVKQSGYPPLSWQ